MFEEPREGKASGDEFETLLSQDDFYDKLSSLEEVYALKTEIEKLFDQLEEREMRARISYQQQPQLQEIIVLQEKINDITDTFENEFADGSPEWTKKENEIHLLEKQIEDIKKRNPEISRIDEELSNNWKQATIEKNQFLSKYKMRKKLKIINKILIPIFELQHEVDDLVHHQKGKLEAKRDQLYSDLDHAKSTEEEKNLESQIVSIEKEITQLPRNIEFLKDKLEQMQRKRDQAIEDLL